MTVLVTGMPNLVMLQLHVYSIVYVALDTTEASNFTCHLINNGYLHVYSVGILCD